MRRLGFGSQGKSDTSKALVTTSDAPVTSSFVSACSVDVHLVFRAGSSDVSWALVYWLTRNSSRGVKTGARHVR